MSSSASVQLPLDPAIMGFEKAMREFKLKLNDDAMYAEILKINSIEQVYALAEAIQAEQAKTGHLRHLAKIEKYLERMKLYADAIDTFVSAKPDILALIWGPMKLLIQWTSTLSKSQDAIAKITAEIGDLLPEFHDMTALFSHNRRLNDVMALFFQDILDFYLISIRFFSKTRRKYLLEALWPKEKSKIELIMSHIERHGTLMRTEVRLEHIREEHQARVRAMEHFERTERENRQQEYHRILTDISPTFYDSKLDNIEGRMCAGTGGWLLQHDRFQRWLDSDKKEERVLWLNGIPGAGKTYLAASVIRRCQGLARTTIYAFLSHALENSTSATSVMHSLIFQLARSADDLQTALCHSSHRDFRSSIDCVAAVLKTLFDCAGPTCLVIDGLDEMKQVERHRLLSHLIKLSNECGTISFLICCRPESDIDRVLGGSPTFRVDHHNSESIEAFVKRETTEWLLRRDFVHEEVVEIEGLLAPLASKANGMFLYARVVISSLELLSNIWEVRSELLVMPQDLNDAYARLLQRINNIRTSSGRIKDKARRLLGFVGCSPAPLTIYELDHLLTLESPHYSESLTHSRGFPLNPIELCGPLVEVLDEYVYFVHFTVKEYLFSPDITGSLNESDMLLQLTTSCLRYMSQDHNRQDLTKDEIEQATMNGLYQIHSYVENAWYPLVEKSLVLPDHQGVLEMLEKTATQMLRDDLDETHNFSPPSNRAEIKALEEYHPRVYQLLIRTSEFRRRWQSSDFHTGNLSRWKSINPLRTSDLYVKIHETLDRLLCGSSTHSQTCCSYSSLCRIYGSRMFKCPYLGCLMRSRGFESNSLRRSHIAHHSRPWKCDVAGCEYSETGFLSRRMQNDHLDKFHREDNTEPQSTVSNLKSTHATENHDLEDIKSIFFDLILADRTEDLKSLSHYFENFTTSLQLGIMRAAAKVASVKSTSFIMDLLKRTSFSSTTEATLPLFLLNFACEAINLELIEWVLKSMDTRLLNDGYPSHYGIVRYMTGSGEVRCEISWASILLAVLLSKSEEVFQRMLPELITVFTTSTWDKSTFPMKRVMSQHVIAACSDCANSEERLLQLWRGIRLILKDEDLGASTRRGSYLSSLGLVLSYIADSCCSVRFARELVNYGADIDYTPGGLDTYRTPLHRALRKSNPKTAEMAKFLLYRGADPESTSRKSSVKSIKDEVGAREISKWIGMTWDELVQKVKEDREAGICPPEYL